MLLRFWPISMTVLISLFMLNSHFFAVTATLKSCFTLQYNDFLQERK